MLSSLAPADGEAILPLADARVHLQLTGSDTAYDDAVNAARADAISIIEDRTRKALQSRGFLWTVDRFSQSLRLPMAPASAVASVEYLGRDGVAVLLPMSAWRLAEGFLLPAAGSAWPLTGDARNSIAVTFTAGYLSPAEIPPLLLLSVKQAMAALFEDRSNPDLSGALNLAGQFRRRIL